MNEQVFVTASYLKTILMQNVADFFCRELRFIMDENKVEFYINRHDKKVVVIVELKDGQPIIRIDDEIFPTMNDVFIKLFAL